MRVRNLSKVRPAELKFLSFSALVAGTGLASTSWPVQEGVDCRTQAESTLVGLRRGDWVIAGVEHVEVSAKITECAEHAPLDVSAIMEEQDSVRCDRFAHALDDSVLIGVGKVDEVAIAVPRQKVGS